MAVGFLPLLLLFAVCVHPLREQYRPDVRGLVLDAGGRPLAGVALVRPAVDAGPAEATRTDARGRFVFPGRTHWRWLHSPLEFALGWMHCYEDLDVSAPDYPRARFEGTRDKPLHRYTPGGGACNNVEFQVAIRLNRTGPAQIR